MSNELCHYGVKGMRWGVRKEPNIKGVALRKNAIPKKVNLKGPALSKNAIPKKVNLTGPALNKQAVTRSIEKAKRTSLNIYSAKKKLSEVTGKEHIKAGHDITTKILGPMGKITLLQLGMNNSPLIRTRKDD